MNDTWLRARGHTLKTGVDAARVPSGLRELRGFPFGELGGRQGVAPAEGGHQRRESRQRRPHALGPLTQGPCTRRIRRRSAGEAVGATNRLRRVPELGRSAETTRACAARRGNRVGGIDTCSARGWLRPKPATIDVAGQPPCLLCEITLKLRRRSRLAATRSRRCRRFCERPFESLGDEGKARKHCLRGSLLIARCLFEAEGTGRRPGSGPRLRARGEGRSEWSSNTPGIACRARRQPSSVARTACMRRIQRRAAQV